MSVEYRDSSVANMDMDDSKIAYKRLLMDPNKLPFSVYSLKQNPFRVATLCLGVLCALLLIGLIVESVSYRKTQQENLNKLQSVNTEKNSLQNTVASLQREKGSMEERQRDMEKRVEYLTKRKEQLQNIYNSLSQDMVKLRESETKLKSSNAALTKDLQQVNATVDKLQSDNTALSTAKDLLQVEFNQAVKLKTTLDSNYKTLYKERNILQNTVNNVTRSKDQLQLSYNRLMANIETLEKKLQAITMEKDKAQTSHMNATTAKSMLQDMYDNLFKATEQLNSTYNDLLKEKQELEKSCGSVQTEKSLLLEQIKNVTTERDQLQLEVVKLNSTIAAKKCPAGWRSHMFSCYYTSETKKNWKNSRDYCKNRGADLAIITSREEMAFINGLYSSDKEVWIGLSDDGIEGHWTWVDGTTLNPNATFWGNGQPNSYDGRNQDCVEFWHRATGNGEWNDESCKIEQYWICEI
ncbi:C-type lectin domain family 4 member M-like [Boleophthalmus pectinirostris]|uniref:C-type lectin domain family 4 member M-like n=1 Tax=Boleophthalmus pectinirostris TaxID=150288 RepID=UPI00242EDC03|nr:C-type lectin domain family 4 member M-like [Boleophthalmus pectinirostris]